MTTFTVAGGRCAEFPMDMLRYDQAWPRDTSDAHAILANELDPPRDPPLRNVTLMSERATPTFDRWASFGWRVTSVDGVPL